MLSGVLGLEWRPSVPCRDVLGAAGIGRTVWWSLWWLQMLKTSHHLSQEALRHLPGSLSWSHIRLLLKLRIWRRIRDTSSFSSFV